MTKSWRTIVKVWLFCLVFLPITLSLGAWQLDRADEKANLLNLIETREALPVSDWQPTADVLEHTFQPYQIIGRFMESTFLLDNRIRDRQVGYEVLSIFELLSGEKVLVNRGWVKGDKYRQSLPVIETPVDTIVLEGYFYLPEGEVPILKETPMEKGWPKRIQKVQWNLIENSANAKLVTQSEFRLAHDKQAGSFQTGWPRTSILPEKHLGYAYQWFALSFALSLLTLLATIKIKKQAD